MAVFRIQDNVPDSYNKPSRDFQLLCNVFDYMNGAVKYDINSIRDVTDTVFCNDVLLNKLKTKLGFFSNVPMNTYTQRLILRAFPYLIKYKGSSTGIKQAIYVYLKTQHLDTTTDIQITNSVQSYNSNSENVIDDVYLVKIGLDVNLMDITILTELLKYILPAGYGVTYAKSAKMEIPHITALNKVTNNINIVFVTQFVNDAIKDVSDTNTDTNGVSTTTVPLSNIPLTDDKGNTVTDENGKVIYRNIDNIDVNRYVELQHPDKNIDIEASNIEEVPNSIDEFESVTGFDKFIYRQTITETSNTEEEDT